MQTPPTRPPKLNQRASYLCQQLIDRQDELAIQLLDDGMDPPVIDCGVDLCGSVEAGLRLAEVCMAGLGRVSINLEAAWYPFPQVTVRTDWPAIACLGAQYAGWRIEDDGYFGMASGAMRAAAQLEPLFQQLPFGESANVAVGVIESSALPPGKLRRRIAEQCQVPARGLTLLIAPTHSLAGMIQIVARSVETALHKLHELQFDVTRIRSAIGTAPLPPAGGDDLTAMGRANDSILYGAAVVLWCDCEDRLLEEIAPQIPSCASKDFGRPFAELFQEYRGDFYQMDKLLFSPAEISLLSLRSGRVFRAGKVVDELVRQSFVA